VPDEALCSGQVAFQVDFRWLSDRCLKLASEVKHILMRKTTLFGLLGALVLLTYQGRAEDVRFKGEIMDSPCAALGGHSAMMNKDINTEKACTLECVKHGGVLVLYDAAMMKTYQLDDQKKSAQFAGEKVLVTGTYDESSQTIHISRIDVPSRD
jgi:hypothetical protein